MRVEKDFEEFIRLLNKHEVRYLIIGAYAVAFHARPRYTGDMDFLVEPVEKNAKRILKVLRDFGFGSLNITEKDLLEGDTVIQLGFEPNRIDLLKSIDGVNFDEAFRTKARGRYGKTRTWFISMDELLKSKKLSSRKKDAADAELLMDMRKLKRKTMRGR